MMAVVTHSTNVSLKNGNSYWKELKGRRINTPAKLLILYAIITGMCLETGFNISFGLATDSEDSSCWSTVPSIITSAIFIIPILQYAVFSGIAPPIIGWLADTRIGRAKAIDFSLWSCWFGTLLQCISYCIQYGTCGLPVNIAKYGISSAAFILLMLGTAGFYANIPPYGLDQLVDESNAQIRAFLHWVVWGWFFGYTIGYVAFVQKSIYDAKILMFTGFIVFVVTSVGVLLNIYYRNHFEPSGVLVKNPYKTVLRVLEYAWHHKFPEKRSAFTYWEEKIPSRIDLGKNKYGGPFSEQEVEDVKSFFRIVGVLISTFGFYIPYYYTVVGIIPIINMFKGAASVNGYGSYIVWDSFDEIVIFLIPLMELVIIPLFPKIEYFILNPLRGIGLSYVLLLIALLSMLIITTVGLFATEDSKCLLTDTNRGTEIKVTFLWFILPVSFSSLANALSYIYGLEFICSQAPANMCGMLMGAFWFIRATYVSCGALFKVLFLAQDLNGPGKLSCSFWILMTQFFLCLVGLGVYIFIAKRYQRRTRGDVFNARSIVEEIFERTFEEERIEEMLESIRRNSTPEHFDNISMSDASM